MKIAILGTKGIPNHYGGFEQFAEYLSLGLVKYGYDITVYSPDFHPHQQSGFGNVKIKHIYCPEKFLGGAAHFIYDYLCLKDALANNYDVIYEAGYATCAHAIQFLKRKKKNFPVVVTNMDGMEWKRSKWSKIAQMITKHSEKIAVRASDFLIADNVGIQEYYKATYGVNAMYLPYGANYVAEFDPSVLKKYTLEHGNYYMLIARLEPENNIETIINGYVKSGEQIPLIIIGGLSTAHAKSLLKIAINKPNIRFLGGIYDLHDLNSLRHYCKAYFHGHSVGGTNPSLLEAMACQTLIIAHRNEFNKSVLGNNALYFSSPEDISTLLRNFDPTRKEYQSFIRENAKKIIDQYNWNYIVSLHDEFFKRIAK